MITIEKATLSDAAILSNLAKAIYQENYLHLWLPGGADWYMNQYAYPAHQMEQELADANNAYYLLLDDQEPVGYLKLVLSSNLAGYHPTDALEIERIYLLENRKGKCLGKKMMQLAMDTALALNKKVIFLKAMDSSQ
jgi:GNAT superfamily N-acetyltransferase